MRQILSSKVRILVFSMDAYDSQGYQKVRRSNKFEIVLKNIKKFHEIRKEEYPDSVTTTRVHGVKVHQDFDEKKFHSFWGEIADEVSLMECISRWDSYNNPKNNKTDPCTRAYDRLYVWFDGQCNPCDVDYKSYLAMGNVKENTISEIWNGKKYSEFRKNLIQGKRLEIVPCNRCDL